MLPDSLLWMCDFYKLDALLDQEFLNCCVFSKAPYNRLASGGTCKQELRHSAHVRTAQKMLILLIEKSQLFWRPVRAAAALMYVCLWLGDDTRCVLLGCTWFLLSRGIQHWIYSDRCLFSTKLRLVRIFVMERGLLLSAVQPLLLLLLHLGNI